MRWPAGMGPAALASLLASACGPEGPAQGPAGAPAGAAAQEAEAAGLAGFEGSALCQTCHPAQSRQWERSLHARTVHEPTDAETQLLSRSLLCGDHDAKLILGERHARRFMVESDEEPGRHVLLPCRYDVGPAEWVSLHESDWQTLTWEKACGACHTTGFSADQLTFREMGVGCESCHGPASRHGGFKSRGEMISFARLPSKDEILICASCHLQGGRSRATGLNYARNYVAGDDLFADYVFDWSELDRTLQDADNPIDVHQKLLIRDAVTRGRDDLRCTSCHEFHEMGHGKHESLRREEFCHLCHSREDFGVKEYHQSCNVCEF